MFRFIRLANIIDLRMNWLIIMDYKKIRNAKALAFVNTRT
jgi:hypothetical protein